MASWDFTIDSDKQNELAGKLSEAADNFDTKISLLYGQIDSMNGTSWVGEDYDTFREGVHNYEGALKDLSNGFRMFGEHYKLMAEGTTTLASDLITIVKNMTGTIDGSSSSGGGSASYDSGAGMSDDVGNEGDASHSPSMSYGADAEEDGNGAHQSESGATHGGGGHRADDASDGESESGTHQSDVVGDTTSSPQGENSENNEPGNLTSDGKTDMDTPTTTSKTITRGDVVSLGNGNYNYYGTTKGGKNIYTDSNQDLYYEDENGNAVNITRSQYMGGTNTQTVNFNVKDIGSSSDVHGYSNPIVLSVDGEYVGYGATTGSNINTSIVYENSDVAPNVVSSVQGDTTGTTYRVGATNMNVSESSDNIVIPRQESEFITAVRNGQDIKLTPDATLKYDPSGWLNTETLTNGRNNVYLRYDQGTQKYYIADENGSYSTSSTGYAPDVLTNGDSSLKFN